MKQKQKDKLKIISYNVLMLQVLYLNFQLL